MGAVATRLTMIAIFGLAVIGAGCGSSDTIETGPTSADSSAGGDEASASTAESDQPARSDIDIGFEVGRVFADIVSFEGDPKHDAMFAALRPIHGPADDLSAIVATVAPFPEVATPTGAVIDSVELRSDSTSVRVVVPMTVEDATALFVDDLESRGWSLGLNRVDPSETSHSFERTWEEESFASHQLDVVVRTDEQPGDAPDRTMVVLDSRGYTGPPELRSAIADRQQERLVGWELAVPDGAARTEASLGSNRLVDDRLAMITSARFEFPDRAYEDVVRELEVNLAAAGLEPVDGAEVDLLSGEAGFFTLPSSLDPEARYGVRVVDGGGLAIIVVSTMATLG